MKFRIETTIYHNGNDIDVVVDFLAHKGYKGKRDDIVGAGGKVYRNAGPPLEPDEPPSIEIESVINIETGEELDLDRHEEELLEEKCAEYANDEY